MRDGSLGQAQPCTILIALYFATGIMINDSTPKAKRLRGLPLFVCVFGLCYETLLFTFTQHHTYIGDFAAAFYLSTAFARTLKYIPTHKLDVRRCIHIYMQIAAEMGNWTSSNVYII